MFATLGEFNLSFSVHLLRKKFVVTDFWKLLRLFNFLTILFSNETKKTTRRRRSRIRTVCFPSPNDSRITCWCEEIEWNEANKCLMKMHPTTNVDWSILWIFLFAAPIHRASIEHVVLFRLVLVLSITLTHAVSSTIKSLYDCNKTNTQISGGIKH